MTDRSVQLSKVRGGRKPTVLPPCAAKRHFGAGTGATPRKDARQQRETPPVTSATRWFVDPVAVSSTPPDGGDFSRR